MNKGSVFLMYHEIQAPGAALCDESAGYRRYVISEEDFTRQLDVIEQIGHKGLTVSEALGAIGSTQSLCITFDDGCASDLRVAAPLLAQKKHNATFYVTVAHLGKSGYLTRPELRELADLGFEIGSHSMNHRHLDDLSRDEVRSELIDSRNALEEIVGKEVAHFSCPGGRINSFVTEAAHEAGYRSVASSILGLNFETTDRFALKRIAIKKDMTPKNFKRLCSGKGQLLMKSSDSVLTSLKRALGNERYDRIRARVLSLVD